MLQQDARPSSEVYEAAASGNIHWLVSRLERDLAFDINAADHLGRTALMWAVDGNQFKTVQCLLDYGADLGCVECNGRTAVHIAAMKGYDNILQLLFTQLTQGAREAVTMQPDKFGMTPTFLAFQRGMDAHECHNILVRYCKKDAQSG